MLIHVIGGKEYITVKDFGKFVRKFRDLIIDNLDLSNKEDNSIKDAYMEAMGFHTNNKENDNMNYYIGTKLVQAEPCKAQRDYDGVHKAGDDGYVVTEQDGYKSWTPKDVFEIAYIPLDPNEMCITQQAVDNFIVETHAETVGDKTTIVRAVLKNGFEIIESSSCVSAKNYDEELGVKICMDKIKDKVWYLLGFLLQTTVTLNTKVVNVSAPTELSDTVKLMNSDNYKSRFIAEYYQLKIRLDKLKVMVEKWENGKLHFTPTCPRWMYYKQIVAMEEYLSVLKERASLEKAELIAEEDM